MSGAGDLLSLARDREAREESVLRAMLLDQPDFVRRQIRDYLSRQVDRRRMKRVSERVPRLSTISGGLHELSCHGAEFASGASLHFDIQIQPGQGGCILRRFRFRVDLAPACSVSRIQIHLNEQTSHDPLQVPLCHMHIGDSKAHVPFPVMHPRLVLSLLCEVIEPGFHA